MDAGTLLEARLETVPGAEKVFDFGALSYADAKTREKLSARTCRVKGGPIPAKLARVQAAQRFVGADLAFAAAWYYTGGDLTALPQRLQSLGADSLPHAGAKLI